MTHNPYTTRNIWYFTNHRQQAILDMIKIIAVFGLPILACGGLTVFVVDTRGFGPLAMTCLSLTMIILSMVAAFMWRSWLSLKGFRMEENYIATDEEGLVVCERGEIRRFAWAEIRTVHEFYALGYGCNLKIVLNHVMPNGLYEHYLFNVDGVPNAAKIYGTESMMWQIDEAWQKAISSGIAVSHI